MANGAAAPDGMIAERLLETRGVALVSGTAFRVARMRHVGHHHNGLRT